MEDCEINKTKLQEQKNMQEILNQVKRNKLQKSLSSKANSLDRNRNREIDVDKTTSYQEPASETTHFPSTISRPFTKIRLLLPCNPYSELHYTIY